MSLVSPLPLRAGAFALALSTVLSGAASAETFNLTLASGYPPGINVMQAFTNQFQPAADAVLKGTGHAINWNFAMAGTLARAPDVFEAVESGLADVGHIVWLFEGARLPLQNVGFYAVFGTEDTRLVTEAHQKLMDEFPALRAEWDAAKQVFLAGYPLDTYELWSRTPINTLADLDGLKIGGGGTNLPWLRGTGAAGVSTTGATAYNDLNSGLIDGVLAPTTLGVNAKWHEVSPYLMRVNFGAATLGALTVNRQVWDGLPAEVQAALRAGAEAWREQMIVLTTDSVEEARARFVENGGTIIDFPPEQRALWASTIPNPATEWLAEDGRREVLARYMEILRAGGVTFPRDWAAE